MKVVITAGGTAGHINPAIALAEELTDRGHEVVFAGTPNRLESRLVPEAGFNFKSFEAKGFNRRKPLSLIAALYLLEKSTIKAKKWLKKFKPDVVIGFGCYVSISICRAAKSLNIPYLIHEQNSVMGMANKFLSKNAVVTCLTYERARCDKSNNVQVIGNPVRKQIFEASKEEGRKLFGIPENALMMLVFGGSLGAEGINTNMLRLAPQLLDDYKNLYVVQITGKKSFKDLNKRFKLSDNQAKRWKLLDYTNKMGLLMAATDVCVCRAGASTLSEITARETPGLLVPFPLATENHQYYNAQTLLEAGCCLFIEDKNTSSPEFEKLVRNLIDDDNLRNNMKDSYKKFDAQNAVSRLADLLESSAN